MTLEFFQCSDKVTPKHLQTVSETVQLNPEHLFNTNVHLLFRCTDQLDLLFDALTSSLWQVLVAELKRREERHGKSQEGPASLECWVNWQLGLDAGT